MNGPNAWHLQETFKALSPIALAALKAVYLLNGGAAVALLAFLGHAASEGQRLDLRWPMGLFLTGVFLAALAHVGAYLTQLALYNETLKEGRVPTALLHSRWLWATVTVAVLSLVVFFCGSMIAVALMAP
jgi:hypothetical protein